MYTCFRFLGNAALALSVSFVGPSTPAALQGERLSAPLEPTVTGSIETFQISPDGEHVVYVGSQDHHEVTELYSALRSGGTPIRLNPPLVEGGDVWKDFVISPDGGRVVYIADQEQDDVFELYSVPIDGGTAPVRLSDVALDSSDSPIFHPLRISPDGKTVLFLTRSVVLDALHAVPVDGSGPAVWLGGQLVGDYRFTPDSQHVVFTGHTLGQLGLFRASRDGTTPVQTLLARPRHDQLDFQISADGAWIVCRSDRDANGVFELFSVPLAGGTTIELQGATDRRRDVEVSFLLSPTGERVVYGIEGAGTFVAPVDGSGAALELDSRTFLYGIAKFSPDGNRLVYRVDVGSVDDLFSVPIDGSRAPVLLTVGTSGAYLFDVTADGTRVVFTSGSDWRVQHQLYRAPIDGGGLPELIHPALPADRGVLDFQLGAARDRVVYRATARQTETIELFTARVDGVGTPVRLSDNLTENGDVYSFQVGPDGTWAVYRADAERDGRFELFVANATHPTPRISGPIVAQAVLVDVGGYELTPDEERVLYSVGRDWFLVPTVPGQKAVRLDVLRGAGHPRFTPDGTRVVFEREDVVYAWPLDESVDPIPLCEAVRFSRWELGPDGSRVVCVSDRDVPGQAELFSAATDGSSGPVQLNSELVAGGTLSTPYPAAFHISADGTRVVYIADQDTDEVFELFSVPIDGSSPPVALSRGSIPLDAVRDVTLDDRSAIAVFRANPDRNSSRNALLAAPLDGSTPPVVVHEAATLPQAYLPEDYRTSPGGTHVVYPLRNGSQSGIYARPIDGSAPSVRLFSANLDANPVPFDISADGMEVVALPGWQLLSRPIDGSLPARELAPNADGRIFRFAFAADGRIVFSDESALYSVPVDGSEPPLLLSDPVDHGVWYELSPNGRSVVYEATVGGQPQLFTSSVLGTFVHRPVIDPLAPERRLWTWLPGRNGRVFYRADQDVFDQVELYATPPTERTHPVPSNPSTTVDHHGD